VESSSSDDDFDLALDRAQAATKEWYDRSMAKKQVVSMFEESQNCISDVYRATRTTTIRARDYSWLGLGLLYLSVCAMDGLMYAHSPLLFLAAYLGHSLTFARLYGEKIGNLTYYDFYPIAWFVKFVNLFVQWLEYFWYNQVWPTTIALMHIFRELCWLVSDVTLYIRCSWFYDAKPPGTSILEYMLHCVIGCYAVRFDRMFVFVPVLSILFICFQHSHFYVVIQRDIRQRQALSRIFKRISNIRYFWSGGSCSIFADNKILANENYVHAIVAMMTLFVGYKGIKMLRDMKRQSYPRECDVMFEEAKTEFVEPSPANAEINKFEEEIEACASYKRYKTLTPIWNVQEDIGPPPMHKLDLESLNRFALGNVCPVHIWGMTVDFSQHILGLEGDIAVINTHALPERGMFEIRLWDTGPFGSRRGTPKVNAIDDTMRLDLGNDLTLVRLPKRRFKKLTHHLVKGAMKPSIGMIAQHKTTVTPEYNSVIELNGTGRDHLVRRQAVHYSYPNNGVGVCGIPVVASHMNGFVVAGIHAMGNTKHECAAMMFPNNLDMFVEELIKRSGYPAMVSECGLGLMLEAPNAKSPIHYRDLSGIRYFGKEPGPVLIKKESQLQSSGVEDELKSAFAEEIEFEPHVKYGPPVMQPIGKGANYRCPWSNALMNMASPRGAVNMQLIVKSAKYFAQHIIKNLHRRGVTRIRPLTVDAAINGAPDDPFIRRINTSTGSGYGFSGKKRDHLPIVSEVANFVTRQPTDDLKRKLLRKLKLYAKGEAAGVVYETQLKDEPREQRKIATANTRVFYPSSVDELIFDRMMLAPFFSLMVEHGDVFGASVGLNAHSGADDFINNLLAFSTKFGEGDYGKYDIKMLAEFRIGVSVLVTEVLHDLGYGELAIKMVQSYLADATHAFFVFNKDVFQSPGSQPSGKYATAEFNCLVNVLMLLVFWFANPRTKDLDFFTYVKPGTYGDDLLQAIKDTVLPYYNNVAYAKFCKDVYGIEFTPASKTGELQPYLGVEEASFLKRRFRYSQTFNRWLMPLEMDSIFKSLLWYIPSKVETREQQISSTLQSACYELFLHLTKKQYTNLTGRLTNIFEQHIGHGYKIDIPTYDRIAEKMFGDTTTEHECSTMATLNLNDCQIDINEHM